ALLLALAARCWAGGAVMRASRVGPPHGISLRPQSSAVTRWEGVAMPVTRPTPAARPRSGPLAVLRARFGLRLCMVVAAMLVVPRPTTSVDAQKDRGGARQT